MNPMEQFGSFESGAHTKMQPKIQNVKITASPNLAEANDYNGADSAA
jgi:hypothetical protein